MTMHKQGLFKEIRACVWYNEKGQKILVKDHTSIFTLPLILPMWGDLK